MEHTGGKPDSREQIDTWTEMDVVDDLEGEPAYMRLQGPNQFFSDDVLYQYKSLTLEWHQKCSKVADALTSVLSLALGLPEGCIGEAMGDSLQRQSLIKYIRYPPTPEGGQGVGMHQDSAFLTLLMPGEEGGLECLLPNGELLPVTRRKGTFVVNLGEALQQMSGNYFIATPHRVIAKSERTSVGFFFGPSLRSKLRPLPLDSSYARAVRESHRHRTSGLMPTREELEGGVEGSLEGQSRHETYGNLLWKYFGRAHPEYMRAHYPDLVT